MSLPKHKALDFLNFTFKDVSFR